MSDSPTVIFSHGQESGPWGTKIQRLAATARAGGFDVESIDYTDLPHAEDRVYRLVEHHPIGRPLVLVGSSMGAYVAARAAGQLQPDGLFLLAPAFALPECEPVEPPLHASEAVIVHGWRDSIISPEPVIGWARQWGTELHLVDDEHRLKERIDRIDAWFGEFLRRFRSAGP